jgi:Type I phosphodiesterase / nucleotide pyrophosphatase
MQSKRIAMEPEKEERKGLLSGETSSKNEALDDTSPRWSRRALVITSLSFIGLLLCASLLPPLFGYHRGIRGDDVLDEVEDERIGFQEDDTLKSNGTHDFKRTVLMVSIDGLRADYLDRGLTPHLLDISRTGLRAKWMRPVFPVSCQLQIQYVMSAQLHLRHTFHYGRR